MANYHIGLDFGTSQSKVCLLNTDNGGREFAVFENGTFFLPSLVTKKASNTFSYGNEGDEGTKYRYFKMAAAEDDEELVRATYETGEIANNEWMVNMLTDEELNNYRRYNTLQDIEPEILSILYLGYILLYIKEKKKERTPQNIRGGGLLGRYGQASTITENTFSIKMGIPTEWHNPVHLKRKIKFETILIVVSELVNNYNDLESYLNEECDILINKAAKINKKYSKTLDSLKSQDEKSEYMENLRNEYRISTFPETVAGIYFLLTTERLENGYYGALDIGAGTSDISIFWVWNNNFKNCICSESVSIASNNVFRDYSIRVRDLLGSYSDIKQIEEEYNNGNIDPNGIQFQGSVSGIRQELERQICKMYCGKYYYQHPDREAAKDNKNLTLPNRPILLYGGGSLFGHMNGLGYRYFPTHDMFSFNAVAAKDFIQQVEIINEDRVEVMENIPLLIVALGLSYLSNNPNNEFFEGGDGNDTPPTEPLGPNRPDSGLPDMYFYYDIQDAAYK